MLSGPPHRHVCMMEGFDPELTLSTAHVDDLQDEKNRADKEISRLRNILLENKIDSSKPEDQKQIVVCAKNIDNEVNPPQLPHEILLIILGYAVTSTVPVTDPFYKGINSNITEKEKTARGQINVNFLATSKVYRKEGVALILKNNDIIFTQAAALANFAKIPFGLRLKIDHATLRVVGRYYGDKANKRFDLSGNERYHPTVSEFKIPLLARPKGMNKDGGIQAYCFNQLADFLKALQLANDSTGRIQGPLFPSLKTMQIDLVNFCDHLNLGRLLFTPVVRWHLTSRLDELLVTGGPIPDPVYEIDAETDVLRNLVKDEGLFSQSNPLFISTENGLKPLPGYGISNQIVRPRECSKNIFNKCHPEGGKPPISDPTRETVFKWALEHFAHTTKTWIEFDYATGKELEPGWQYGDSDYDSDEHDDYVGSCCCEDCLYELEVAELGDEEREFEGKCDDEDEEDYEERLSEGSDVSELSTKEKED